MRYGFIVCVVLVCLTMLVGCQEEPAQTEEYQWQLSSGEAIALAQDDFDDWLSEIDCRGGKMLVKSILCKEATGWSATKITQTFSEFLQNTEGTPKWAVNYGDLLLWYVYDESRIVELVKPSWADMQTYKQLGISRCGPTLNP